MKKHLELLLIFITINICTLILYLGGALCNCNLNVCYWSDFSKEIVLFFMGVSSCISVLVPLVFYLDNKNK